MFNLVGLKPKGRTMFIRVLLCLMIFAAASTEGKTLRWATQGDALTMDPHAQNETFTNATNNLVYEQLFQRGKDYNLAPWLAISARNEGKLKWIVTLRRDVKWQDGTPFTADDVVFSFARALGSGSTFKLYSSQAGVARKVDDYTVEFTTPVPNPVMVTSLATIPIMSKTWCEKHQVTKPQDFTNKEESYASRNAMGTGEFRLVSYEPGVKIVHQKNEDWWGLREGLFEGNVDRIEYRPIANQATRMAAIKSGEVDIVIDPPLQDIPGMRSDPNLKIWDGDEVRVILIGLDQARDELLYSDVKGKNPFKDKRVRQAMFQAIDINAIKSQVMRGLATPTGIALPDPKGAGVPAADDKRLPLDPTGARKLLTEAGYPNGFSFTLHCPNDRYVNDEKICIALSAMWARVGLKVRVESMTKTLYFQKLNKLDVSAFMVGWGGGSQDAIFMFKPVLHSRNDKGAGDGNYGNFKHVELDRLIDAVEEEMDPAKRQELINTAARIVRDEVLVLPLHRQVIPWVSRKGVMLHHMPNNILTTRWVKLP